MSDPSYIKGEDTNATDHTADSPGAWQRREAGSVPRPRPGTDKALSGRSLLHATRPSGELEARVVHDGTCSPEGAERGHVSEGVHPAEKRPVVCSAQFLH